MDWIALDMAIIDGTYTPQTLAAFNTTPVAFGGGMVLTEAPPPAPTQANAPPGVTIIDGMPIENYIAGPTVDPMAGFGNAAPLTPANAPPGVTIIDGMPIENYIAGPTVDPMAGFSAVGGVDPMAGFGNAAPLTPANALAGVTFTTGNMPLFGGDHGTGGQ